MAASHSDPAWPAFREWLKREMNEPGRILYRVMASSIGVKEETLRSWRRGRSRPHLDQLADIADAVATLRARPRWQVHKELLSAMGLFRDSATAEEVLDAAHRYERLQQKAAAAAEQAARFGRVAGASAVAQAAVSTREWAVAVWPAVEGPADCRMHTADNIDFRRTDGRPVRQEEVWDHPILKTALRASYAIPAHGGQRWHGGEDVSSWTILHLGLPRSPLRTTVWPGLATVQFFALTRASWVVYLADLTATALGYGLSTTRDLVLEAYGARYDDASPEHLWEAHRYLSERPPSRRVWAHYGWHEGSAETPFDHHGGPWRDDVIYVWLKESDEMLANVMAYGGQDARGTDLATLLAAKSRLEEAVTALRNPDQVITVDCASRTARDERWAQVLNQTRATLSALDDMDAVELSRPGLMRVHEQLGSGSAGEDLLSWLRSKGWPGR